MVLLNFWMLGRVFSAFRNLTLSDAEWTSIPMGFHRAQGGSIISALGMYTMAAAGVAAAAAAAAA